jgi:1-acyl-sn-glycerol-3-phosphate acyltransferase
MRGRSRRSNSRGCSGTPRCSRKKQLFNIPVWGQAAHFYGLIPVDRDGGGKAMRAMLNAAKAALAKDRPLVLFAEGTRIPHGSAPPLRSGFAGIYRLLGVPVIPVAVNSGIAYPAAPLGQMAGDDHLQGRRNDPRRPAARGSRRARLARDQRAEPARSVAGRLQSLLAIPVRVRRGRNLIFPSASARSRAPRHPAPVR